MGVCACSESPISELIKNTKKASILFKIELLKLD
jgi:hypothetical protein